MEKINFRSSNVKSTSGDIQGEETKNSSGSQVKVVSKCNRRTHLTHVPSDQCQRTGNFQHLRSFFTLHLHRKAYKFLCEENYSLGEEAGYGETAMTTRHVCPLAPTRQGEGKMTGILGFTR